MIICTAACWEMPECKTCGLRKHPRGRDPVAANSYCGVDCPGYYEDPKPGHFWPTESLDLKKSVTGKAQ